MQNMKQVSFYFLVLLVNNAQCTILTAYHINIYNPLNTLSCHINLYFMTGYISLQMCGNTALHMAAESGHLEVTKMLVEYGRINSLIKNNEVILLQMYKIKYVFLCVETYVGKFVLPIWSQNKWTRNSNTKSYTTKHMS